MPGALAGGTPDEWMDDEDLENMHGHQWPNMAGHGNHTALPFPPYITPHNTYITDIAHFLDLQPQLRELHLRIHARKARLRPLLSAVASAPSLRCLALSYLGDIPRVPWSAQENQDPACSNVTILRLQAPLVRGIVDLVSIVAGQLDELTISHHALSPRLINHGGRDALDDLIDAIVLHAQLRVVRLKGLRYRLLGYGDVARLGECTMLEVLEITSEGTLVLTDGELRVLVAHLPALTSLKIEGTRGKDEVPYQQRLSMAALAIVATKCPHIQYINIDVDGTEMPEYIVMLPLPIETLHTIDLGWSYDRPIDDPRAVALYLSQLSSHDDYRIHVEWNRAKTGTIYNINWEKAVRWLGVIMQHPAAERPQVVKTLA